MIKDALRQLGVKVLSQVYTPGILEGTNILRIDTKLIVGIGKRANKEGVKKLEETFPDFEIVPVKVPMDAPIVDYVNILEKDLVVIGEEVLHTDLYRKLKEMEIDIVVIPREESERKAMHFLRLSSRKVLNIVSPFNRKLSMLGYDVIQINFSEFLKANAGIYPCVLPIED